MAAQALTQLANARIISSRRATPPYFGPDNVPSPVLMAVNEGLRPLLLEIDNNSQIQALLAQLANPGKVTAFDREMSYMECFMIMGDHLPTSGHKKG